MNDEIKSEFRHTNEKIDMYHRQVMDMVKPMKELQDKDHDKIVSLKRDRYWIFTLCITAFSGAAYAIFERIFK